MTDLTEKTLMVLGAAIIIGLTIGATYVPGSMFAARLMVLCCKAL